jgi:hypothetical protein
MINLKQESSNLCKLVSELIGYRLSKVKGQGSTKIPSVLIKRTPILEPSFPYACVDFNTPMPQGRDIRDKYLDEDDNEVTVQEFATAFSVEIFGGVNEDTAGIATELQTRLYTSSGSRALRNHIPNMELLQVTNPVFSSSTMSTEYKEVTRIMLNFSLVNIITDTSNEIIEKIQLTGSKYDDFEDSQPSHIIQTNVPLN